MSARDPAKRRIPNGRGPVRRWTAAENERLRELFGAVSAQQLAEMLGRSPSVCARHAASLGFGGAAAAKQGFEPIDRACARHGYGWTVMKRIVTWAGLHAERIAIYPEKGKRTRRSILHYRTHSVDDAVEAWRKTETPGEAAERTGVHGNTLRRWLREAGVPGDPRVLAMRLRLATEKRTGRALGLHRSRREWRVDRDVIDALVRDRIRADTMATGAERNGLTRQVVCRLLAEAKVPRVGHKWIVPEWRMGEICAVWWRKRLAFYRRVEARAARLLERSERAQWLGRRVREACVKRTARLEAVRGRIREIEARLAKMTVREEAAE